MNTTIGFIGFFIGLEKYGIEKYGIDVFYNRKFQKWLVYNSTDTESLDSDNDKFLPKYDDKGFITNAIFTPFENSITLIEEDFINEEFRNLAFFDVTKLKSKHRRVIRTYERYLNKRLNQLQQNEAVKPDEKYKTENLFKVGKLFATGEMNKYYTIMGNNEMASKNGLSPLKIAKELGNPSFEKWILASKNNYKTGESKNKNIFNNLDMMTKIISDCKAKNIPVEPYFISRLPIE